MCAIVPCDSGDDVEVQIVVGGAVASRFEEAASGLFCHPFAERGARTWSRIRNSREINRIFAGISPQADFAPEFPIPAVKEFHVFGESSRIVFIPWTPQGKFDLDIFRNLYIRHQPVKMSDVFRLPPIPKASGEVIVSTARIKYRSAISIMSLNV